MRGVNHMAALMMTQLRDVLGMLFFATPRPCECGARYLFRRLLRSDHVPRTALS